MISNENCKMTRVLRDTETEQTVVADAAKYLNRSFKDFSFRIQEEIISIDSTHNNFT